MQQHDERMRHAFADQAKALHGLSDQRIPKGDAIVIGCETEFSVVDYERLTPVSEQRRDAIVGAMPDSADVELGAFQLELKTKPISVTQHGLKAVVEAQAKVELAATAAAVSQGAALLRAGAYPLPMDIAQIPRTSKEKYRQVPDFHDAHRQRFVDTTLGRDGILNVNSAAVIALANSFQVNLQAADGDDAIRVANTWLSFVPEAAAITGNARFLAGVDTGLSDVRMAAWERSHDTRSVIDFLANRPTRIGLPEDYYGGLDDYFERVASFPFILHHEAAALQVGIGLYWNDVRIKFLGGHIVVEFRPISTQPTIEEDVAVLALLLGG